MRRGKGASILVKLLGFGLVLVALMVTMGVTVFVRIETFQGTMEATRQRTDLAQGAQMVQSFVYSEGMSLLAYVEFRQDTDRVGVEAAAFGASATLDNLVRTAGNDPARAVLDDLISQHAVYEGVAQRVVDLTQRGQTVEALELLKTTARPLLDQMIATAERLTQETITAAHTAFEEADQRSEDAQLRLILLPVATVLVGLILSFWMARHLSLPLRRLADTANRVAAGDLTVEELKVTTGDETGEVTRAFNHMVVSLRTLRQSTRASGKAGATAAE